MSKHFLSVFFSVGTIGLNVPAVCGSSACQQITAGALSSSPMTVRVASNSTTTSSSLGLITGLSWALPSIDGSAVVLF
jgi:hypothetical protein